VFFEISKLFWFVATPSTALALLVLLGLALGFTPAARLGRGLAVAGAVLLAVAAFSPLGYWLIVPLEQRFPPRAASAPAPDGVIVLGGAADSRVGAARDAIELVEAGDRVLALVALARAYPEARLVFTGGSATLLEEFSEAEAEMVRRRIGPFGLDPARLIIEDRSRNTHENALFTRAIVRPAPGERWLLVTSAWHMPRAMGVFREAGFDVEAYPVDYRSAGEGDLSRPFPSLSSGLAIVDLAAKEWIGLIAYRLTGRTDALFPAP
jgi:uncharacterized SAM-binding protein YcdF (DUF218 family)